MKVFIIAVFVMILIEVLLIMYSEPTETTSRPVYSAEDYKHDHIVLWDLISRLPVTELCSIIKKTKGLRQASVKQYVIQNNKKIFTTDIDGILCFACTYVNNYHDRDNEGLLDCCECPVKWIPNSNKFHHCMDDNATYILWIDQVAYLSDLLLKCDYDCTDLEVLATYERICELARTIRDGWRD